MNVPKSFMAGNTVSWTETFTSYPASEWELSIYLLSKDGKIQIDGVEDGDSFDIELDPATTKDYTPGIFSWTAFVYKETESVVTERYQVGQGTIEILADIAQLSAGYDTRTLNRRILDALNDLIEGKAIDDVASYSIAGRSISLMPIKDLLDWRDRYAQYVRAEEKQEKIDRGEDPGNKILPSF
jgi:hypothetical protein